MSFQIETVDFIDQLKKVIVSYSELGHIHNIVVSFVLFQYYVDKTELNDH
jgi:hypothetical protein